MIGGIIFNGALCEAPRGHTKMWSLMLSDVKLKLKGAGKSPNRLVFTKYKRFTIDVRKRP